MDFDFYAGGIEDAIIETLTAPMTEAGVKMIETYSGQLDDPESLKAAIAAKARNYPLVMVSYGDGADVKMPGTSPVLGRSLHFRHDCYFAVMCVSTDARGENQRRRLGAYPMMGQVRRLLTGLRYSKIVEEEVEGETVETKYLLTTQPLIPIANEYIAKMPNMTAYAVIFETAFKWSSPDRTLEGTDVDEIIVGVGSINSGVVQNPHNLPGVTVGS